MGFESFIDTIESEFETEFSNTRPNVAIRWPNDPRGLPSSTPWVRATVLPGTSEQTTLGGKGNRTVRTVGQVVIQVFTDKGVGEGEARRTADDIASAMELKTVSGVILRAASVESVGPDDAFYQYNVTIPFQSDKDA